MKFKFKYNDNYFELDVKKCESAFSKFRGLMFKKKSPCLLFIFNKQIIHSIHSFFCQPFIAIWFNKNKIIELKIIKSWRFSIRPKKRFDKLLEIPIKNRYSKVILDGIRKV